MAPPLLQNVLGALLMLCKGEVRRGGLSRWKEGGSAGTSQGQGQMTILQKSATCLLAKLLCLSMGGYLDLEVWAARPILHSPWG